MLLAFLAVMAFRVARQLEVNDHIVVVAHRGYSRDAPENSMSAFRKAIEVGADVIELDVQETSDGVIVVLHDRDLMRLAGDPRRDRRPLVCRSAEARHGQARWAEFAGERIATLDDVITWLAARSSCRSS